MKLHHIAIWTFRLEELKISMSAFWAGQVMRNISIPRRDSNHTLSLLMKVPLWS